MSETRNKYHAKRCACDQGGTPHTHDSLVERNRCLVLHLRQAAGELTSLNLQPRYPLEVHGVHVATYIADFFYIEIVRRDGEIVRYQRVTEDVKGVRTAVYKIKRALMQACHGIEIREVE